MNKAPHIDPRLLDRLLRTTDYVGVEELARHLSQPRSQVLKELQRLQEADCRLDSRPDQGIRLLGTGLGSWVDYLRWSLGGDPHWKIEVYARTGSTQDVVRRLLEQSEDMTCRALAAADQQTAGRGRLGRRWFAPPGSSVIVSLGWLEPPDQPPCATDRLILASSVAVARAIEQAVSPSAPNLTIKWPNDILLEGRKLAGILVERCRVGKGWWASIIGIGINVCLDPRDLPPELAPQVASLASAGCGVDRLPLLAQTILHLEHAVHQAPQDWLIEQWRRRNALGSQRINCLCDGRSIRGQVVDLDPQQGLILRTDAGAVIHLPGATTTLS